MDLKNLGVNILGYGLTNQAVVRLLNLCGLTCHIYDDAFNHKKHFDSMNTYHSLATLESSPAKTISLLSPGIAPSTPSLKAFSYLLSDYDLVYFLLQEGLLDSNPFSVWISGTNGKTTTTEMSARLLDAKAAGNIGRPLADLLASYLDLRTDSLAPSHKDKLLGALASLSSRHSSDSYLLPVMPCAISPKTPPSIIWILETSSFSLHWTRFALPNLYILLPLRPDHISWHGGYEEYVKAKLDPLVRMNTSSNLASHCALLPKDLLKDKVAKDIIASCKARIFLYEDSSHLWDSFDLPMDLKDSFMEPFRLDLALSLAGARFANLSPKPSRLEGYEIGAYRMQQKTYKGLCFVNDSKATNPSAAIAALQAFSTKDIYLLLGGDAKGASLESLYDYCAGLESLRVFSLGQEGAAICKACVARGIDAKNFKNLEEAMTAISNTLEGQDSKAIKNAVVLLSPACASLDQFSSYKERGEAFDALIERLFSWLDSKNARN